MKAGGFRKRDDRCGIVTGGHCGAENRAFAIDPFAQAVGRWITPGEWPKWRQEVLENGAAHAVNPPGVTGAPTAAHLLSTTPSNAGG